MAKWDLDKARLSKTFEQRMDKTMSLFRYEHLPDGEVKETSKIFASTAAKIVETLPESAECTLSLRALWEAKNLAVYAKIVQLEAEKEVQDV